MEKLVSIIIPVYNAAKTLRRCVESIVFGSYQQIEVILVDDRSKDDSWELCQQLREAYPCVKCFQNKQNSGVSCTRNRGLLEATGMYLCFVDSDDWVSGQYVLELVAAAEQHPKELVACGFHFINQADNLHQDYIWDAKAQSTVCVPMENAFDLVNKVLLQAVWNKIFVAETVRTHALQFDVKKSMGEDFEFVLDYLEKGNYAGFFVLNRPLYYYIRANNQSLMSQFGLDHYDLERKRYERVFALSGCEAVRKILAGNIESLRQNYIYHIMHASQFDRQEKLARIEALMQDGQADAHYRRHMVVIAKEQIVRLKNKLAALPGRITGKLNHTLGQYRVKKMRKQIGSTSPSIISQNCIGGVLYHDMGWAFLSPTVNLYIAAADFVKLVNNLKHYLAMELHMRWGETYPIGILGDVEIHFMHYDNCFDAKAAWIRRCSRINWNNILVLSTDRDGFTDAVFAAWKKLPYPKILFTANPMHRNDPDSLYFGEYAAQNMVGDLIPRRKFYQKNTVLNKLTDIIK